MLGVIIVIFLLIILFLNIFLILCFREYIIKSGENKIRSINQLLNSNFSSYEKLLKDELTNKILSLIDIINNRLNEITLNVNSSIDTLKNQINKEARLNREELSNSFDKILVSLEKHLKELTISQNNLILSTEKKLDIMRDTVDEKLQSTLENRLSKSFDSLSKRLELLHEGIGEVNSLALSLNDLRKILSNVKTRGIIGEYQLENLLSQTLTENQYLKNVITKEGTQNRVEFALKVPSKNKEKELLLPIDSKFPLDNYTKLIEAYENSDKTNITKYSKLLETSIKKFSKDISEKYIDPNNTTDFGILFLPIESLYSEISKRVSLIEEIQKEYKIIVTGPTTLYALLNSLSLAFRTLSIEKHSNKVWKILGEVKKEFEGFANILKKAKDKLDQVSNDLTSLSTTKTKNIENKLKDIDYLPYTY